MNYEKLHDVWIRNINVNRNRLLELFNRINTIEQSIVNTEKVFRQFNYIKLSLRPNMLIFYNEIHLFIKRRLEINFLYFKKRIFSSCFLEEKKIMI
jgi:hypothetical protein